MKQKRQQTNPNLPGPAGQRSSPDNPLNSPLMLWMSVYRNYTGTDCLFWPFGRNSAGYAVYGRGGKMSYVHRYMCIWRHGEPQAGHQAAHSCGQGHKGCVNPQHLSWKTPRDNQIDRRKHGTQSTGRHRPKLSQAQVATIRASEGTEPPRALAARFGVSEARIRQIQSRAA